MKWSIKSYFYSIYHVHRKLGYDQCGQIWRNFAKKIKQTFSMFQEFYLVFGSILNLFGLKIAIGQSFIILNGQILKNDLPIWSHWFNLQS